MERSGPSPLEFVLYGFGGAAIGALGTVLVSRLLPEAKPGDGFSTRWISGEGVERRVDFGENEASAVQKAVDMAAQFPGVEVIEIRSGRVKSIQRAGTAQKEVA